MEKEFLEIAKSYGLNGNKLIKILKFLYKKYPTWKHERECCKAGIADKLIQKYISSGYKLNDVKKGDFK